MFPSYLTYLKFLKKAFGSVAFRLEYHKCISLHKIPCIPPLSSPCALYTILRDAIVQVDGQNPCGNATWPHGPTRSLAYYAPLAIFQSFPLHHSHSTIQFRLLIFQQKFQESHHFAIASDGAIHEERFLRISRQQLSYL